jgi:hypothetical protein
MNIFHCFQKFPTIYDKANETIAPDPSSDESFIQPLSVLSSKLEVQACEFGE